MCLGIPGRILEIEPDALGMTMGKVSFGGIAKEICLAYVPDVEVGDFVIVHAGFAISKLDEQEAMEVFDILREMEDLSELETSQAHQAKDG
jgi:hydrogenase expression/formation protein HypC